VGQNFGETLCPETVFGQRTTLVIFLVSSEEYPRGCAKTSVFATCIGITRDLVLFQPTVMSLSIPQAEFADAAKAVALIRAKLAETQHNGAGATGVGMRGWEFVPVSVAGIALVRCGCSTTAWWALEVVTAAAYLVWILLTRTVRIPGLPEPL
jgi:hypothetical protein